MRALAGTLRAGIRVKAAQTNLRSFSRQAKENTNYRLFFPTVGSTLEDVDLIVVSALGRSLEQEALGKSFVCYGEEEYEQNLQTGKIRDLTTLVKLENVARAFHAAECEQAKKAKEKELTEEAKLMGKDVNPVTVAEALRRIQVVYFGDNETTPKVLPERNPVIGRLSTPLVTEVYAIPLDKDGIPDFKNSFHAAMPLSGTKITQLTSILGNADYCRPSVGFLEVGYDYKGETKQAAGRAAALTGIAESLTLEKNPKTTTIWEANKEKLNALSRDPDVMLNKNPQFAYACSVNYVISAFDKYVSTKSLTLVHLDFESELVKKNTDVLLELQAVKSAPTIQQKLLAVAAEHETEETDTKMSDLNNDAVKVAKATTLSELEDIDLDEIALGLESDEV